MSAKNIVITGSTKGIGRGMAEQFMGHGHNVIISSRKQADCERVAAELSAAHPESKAAGFACQVRDHEQVQALWNGAVEALGSIDIWINNAGVSNRHGLFKDLSAEEFVRVVDTNLIGSMNCCKVAINGMLAQDKRGQVYNFEGFGSDGRTGFGMSVYGSTKRSLVYLTEALAEEVDGSNVQVTAISPGMVITDMILEQASYRSGDDWEMAKAMYNCLGDTVETVTPWIVEQVLANEAGERIAWLTPEKVEERFASEEYASRDLFAGYSV